MEVVDLPPGFRFHPTDEEIITFYLTEKVINGGFSATAIGEADLNKCEPWDLPQMAKMGEKEWYFFCQRDRKYPTGMRTNRATESGYWKATGKDKEIFQGKSGCLAGMKKTLVFYKGRAPKGQKTNWVMHEYRLEGKFSYHHHLPKSAKNEWVVCRVFHKNVTAGFKRLQIPVAGFSSVLPPLVDPTNLINVETGGFDDGVLKGSSARSIRSSIDDGYYDLKYFSVGANEQPIRNFSPLPTNSSAGGMMINVSQRSNNNPEFLYPKMAPVSPSDSSFSSEKMMNYYVPEQQPMGSRPVVTAAATGFVDIGCGTAEQLVSSSSLDQTRRRYCKMEQLSSTQHSMMSVSQDTGLSADVNNTTEISSVDAARRILGEACYDDFNGAGAISDLDQLWEY